MTSPLFQCLHILKPKPCPYPLIRVGPSSDGGYLLPDDFSGIYACFSPGNDNRKFFEDHLLRQWRICSYLLDKSSSSEHFETPLDPAFQFFTKLWLGANSDLDTITLYDWILKSNLPP